MVILFSQVREDYKIEEHILNGLNNPTIAVVGSGGCTALSLLNNNIQSIDIIDSNSDQINLIKIKSLIIKFIGTKKSILDIFEGRLNKTQYDNIFKSVNMVYELKQFWIHNKNFFYNGLNQAGSFEILFKDLVESNFNFEKFFNRKYLSVVFGDSAVAQSINKEFYDHFSEVINRYKNFLNPEKNYFYHQILFNRYNPNFVPKYLSQDGIQNIIKYSDKLKYHTADFHTFLKDSSNNKYDMIQTSNLTDWMEYIEREQFIKECWRCLKPNGYIIMRRLNGDYTLDKLTQNLFVKSSTQYDDMSCFYTELFIGKKSDID